jgi:hypothetical protein
MERSRNDMSTDKKSDDFAKAKMLEALAKKQKNNNTRKSTGPLPGSKVGEGQTSGAALKMHRRKSGSA